MSARGRVLAVVAAAALLAGIGVAAVAVAQGEDVGGAEALRRLPEPTDLTPRRSRSIWGCAPTPRPSTCDARWRCTGGRTWTAARALFLRHAVARGPRRRPCDTVARRDGRAVEAAPGPPPEQRGRRAQSRHRTLLVGRSRRRGGVEGDARGRARHAVRRDGRQPAAPGVRAQPARLRPLAPIARRDRPPRAAAAAARARAACTSRRRRRPDRLRCRASSSSASRCRPRRCSTQRRRRLRAIPRPPRPRPWAASTRRARATRSRVSASHPPVPAVCHRPLPPRLAAALVGGGEGGAPAARARSEGRARVGRSTRGGPVPRTARLSSPSQRWLMRPEYLASVCRPGGRGLGWPPVTLTPTPHDGYRSASREERGGPERSGAQSDGPNTGRSRARPRRGAGAARGGARRRQARRRRDRAGARRARLDAAQLDVFYTALDEAAGRGRQRDRGGSRLERARVGGRGGGLDRHAAALPEGDRSRAAAHRRAGGRARQAHRAGRTCARSRR